MEDEYNLSLRIDSLEKIGIDSFVKKSGIFDILEIINKIII